MKSTREKIVQILLKHPRATIDDLAKAVEINQISVRHHLNNLLTAGIVAADEERHGIGRPRLVFFLTEKGLEQFPTRYLHLTNRLLDRLKDTLPPAMVNDLFTQIASDIASTLPETIKDMPIEGKLELVKSLLLKEGFSIEWKKQGSQYQIDEISCPYFHIGVAHPEICAVDQALLSRMLAVPVEKVSCILHGDAQCTYIISEKDSAHESTPYP